MKEYLLSLTPYELQTLFFVVRSVYDDYFELDCPNEIEQMNQRVFKSLVSKIANCPYVKESSTRSAK